jgi:membrane protein YqaA with SNARE-associated domain
MLINWLKNLYSLCLDLASHRHALWWLALVSFAESSFFLIPPDVLLIPICLAQPKKAFRAAFICTIASVLGGYFGYLLGYIFMDEVGGLVLSLYTNDYQQTLDDIGALYDSHGFWAVFIAGFSPIPYKVFTVVSGMLAYDLINFGISSTLSRGLRFFIIATSLYYGGDRAKVFIEKHFARLTMIAVCLLVLLIVIFKLN